MKSIIPKVFPIFLFFMASTLCAQTMETNIAGLVIKDYQCTGLPAIRGNLINRNAESFTGALRVKIIDKENDIIWQGIQKINVDAQNGKSFYIPVNVGNCLTPNKVQIILER